MTRSTIRDEKSTTAAYLFLQIVRIRRRMQNRRTVAVSSHDGNGNGGRSSPGRGLARHRHLRCRGLDARRQRLLVKTGQLSSTPKRLEIGKQIQRFLCWLISAATEKPGIRRHNRIAYEEPGVVKMSELPVAGMKVEFARQIRPDAARSPKLRVIILGFPCFGRGTEAAHIRRDVPDLLSVTVGASLASINDSAPLLGGGERWHGDWSYPLDFIFQFFSRKDRQNKKRKGEETDTCAEGDHMCMAEPSGRDEFV